MFVKVESNGVTYHFNVAHIIYTRQVGDSLEVMIEGAKQAFPFSDPEAIASILAAIEFEPEARMALALEKLAYDTDFRA